MGARVARSCVQYGLLLLWVLNGAALLLKKHAVQHADAVCNDGSPAVYFYAPEEVTANMEGVLILLEAGGDCWDPRKCKKRNHSGLWYMTSEEQPLNRTVDHRHQPVLSDDCDVNPAFCAHLKVFVHYCSSDKWSGDAPAGPGGFHFRGHVILREVVFEVLDRIWSVRDEFPDSFVLMGQSAGGVGVISQTEFVYGQIMSAIAERNPLRTKEISYVTFSDSGWNLDGSGYPFPKDTVREPGANLCTTSYCNLHLRFAKAMDYWNLQVSPSCADALGHERRYLCLFGDWSYEHILAGMSGLAERHEPLAATARTSNTPFGLVRPSFFVAMYKHDSWQARNDFATTHKVDPDEKLWIDDHRGSQYLEQLNRRVEQGSFGFFVPSCYDHILTKSSMYNKVLVQGITLSRALLGWMNQESENSSFQSYADSCAGFHCNPTCGGRGPKSIRG